MAEAEAKVPVKTESGLAKAVSALDAWQPFKSLHREMDRLFEDFDRRWPWTTAPSWRADATWIGTPAVDVAETDKTYEITAELPGMAEKDIEVKIANGRLTIRGEKQEEKEEKKKDYHISERLYGAFERAFLLPDGVDTDKIEANFKNGVLKVTVPKTPEAQKAEKKIEVKGS